MTDEHKIKLAYGKYKEMIRKHPNKYREGFRNISYEDFRIKYIARRNTLRAEGSDKPTLKSLFDKETLISEKQAKGLKKIKKNKELLEDIKKRNPGLAKQLENTKNWREIQNITSKEIDDIISARNKELKDAKIDSKERAKLIGVEFYGSPD